MRLTFLTASTQFTPRDTALIESVRAAGHDVAAEHAGAPPGWREKVRRRLQRPDIILPATSRMVEPADAKARDLAAWVLARPGWPQPGRSLITAAPGHPSLSVPVGSDPSEAAPWEEHAGATPAGRHRGRRVALCYRSTPGSPAHYLRSALERAGVEVVVTTTVDYNDIQADAIVIVESPTPPLEFVGKNPGIPVVFWVHHGEHHLDGNLRLADQYGADLVLLAHSWHLAFRFDRAVERFPFGCSPEQTPTPYDEREWDLAFVGSVTGTAYERRRQLLDEARSILGKVRVETAVSPSDIPGIYGNARSVLNDGGTRHFPITMRVFEAIAAGALLVTDPAPGLDLLFDGQFVGVDDNRSLATTINGPGAQIAATARDRAFAMHTYDHRVDLLFRFLEGTQASHHRSLPPSDPIGRFLHGHPYGQRILDDTGLVAAADREVWGPSQLRTDPEPASFDTAVVTANSDPAIARSARRYVIGFDLDPASFDIPIRNVDHIDRLTIIDVGGAGYDTATVGS